MEPPFYREFGECGGYDCMTGAWTIYDARRNIVALVDQSDYGQDHCDYDYRSEEADRVSRIIVNALNADYGSRDVESPT